MLNIFNNENMAKFIKYIILLLVSTILATGLSQANQHKRRAQKKVSVADYEQTQTSPANFRLLKVLKASMTAKDRRSYVQRVIQVPRFDSIVIEKDINALINANSPAQNVVAMGSEAAMLCLNAEVKNHELFLGYRSLYDIRRVCRNISVAINTDHLEKIVHNGSGKVTINKLKNTSLIVEQMGSGSITINGRNIALHTLFYRGDGDVFINGLNTYDLNIDGEGYGAVVLNGIAQAVKLNISDTSSFRLRGDIGLDTLNYKGPGILTIDWIDSPCLRVKVSDGGRLQLAGVIGVLNARVTDHGVLDARYLHAETAAVEADRCAVAHVWAGYALYAFAKNYSNIYYYHKPIFFNPIGKQSGSILPIYEAPFTLQEFDPPRF